MSPALLVQFPSVLADSSHHHGSLQHVYEKVLTVTYGMLTVLGSLHVPLIGPMALCPAMGGTLGLVGVVRAIRGLLICANASSACFSLVYLLVAFVSVPMMVETCLHLDDNRQECYHCPATSRFSTCPAHNTQDLGAYCYLSNEGSGQQSHSLLWVLQFFPPVPSVPTDHRRSWVFSGCMADDCHELAAGSDKRCYCSHDYWGQTWDQACSEEQQVQPPSPLCSLFIGGCHPRAKTSAVAILCARNRDQSKRM